MSRIGKKPIVVPSGVTVQLAEGSVDVKGPKGQLRQPLPPGIVFELAEGQLHAKTASDKQELRKFHGLGRTLVANAVLGVTEGFKKELDIVGVGYRAEAKGRQVVLALGYSHPCVFDLPAGIEVAVVGQVAADIRALRKPDPYKQKGVRYTGEVLKKKVGKTGA